MTTQPEHNSTLESRNVTVGNKRTSMRLEPQMWNAIEEIAVREGVTINNLCTQIDERRTNLASTIGLTSATRVFIIAYFRRLVWEYERPQSDRSDGDSDCGTIRSVQLKGASLAGWVLDKVIADRAVDGQDPAPD